MAKECRESALEDMPGIEKDSQTISVSINIEDFDKVIRFLIDKELEQNTQLRSDDIFDAMTIAALLLVNERIKSH